MKDAFRSNAESDFRKPTDEERSLLEHLLEAEFPGRDELAPMVRSLLVRTIDEHGGLELRSEISGEAPVVKRIPVEAEAKGDDGFRVHALLHVVGGRPVELEIYKDDGSTVKRMPLASAFELIVLPPVPSKVH
ncbi:MAG TPA: hypothetical protein VMI32_01265 [Candidatus Solibacter sp.]|nr:hypothetical protein [Candidatus Solibacter sp.]